MNDTALLSSSDEVRNQFALFGRQQCMEALTYWQRGRFPEAVVTLVHEHPQIFEPLLLEVLAGYREDGLASIREDMQLHVSAFFILAKYGSREALPLMIDILCLVKGEWGDNIFGDFITEDVPYHLVACYHGDVAPLLRLIQHREAYLFARMAAVRAFEILHAVGLMDADEIWRIVEPVVRAKVAHIKDGRDETDVETDMVSSLLDLLATLSVDRCQALIDNLQWDEYDKAVFDIAFLQSAAGREHLVRSAEKTRENLHNLRQEGLFFLRNIPFFAKDQLEEDAEQEQRMVELYRENNQLRAALQHKMTPKIGRNDPCHCGSGKKYKKCCYLAEMKMPDIVA